MAGRTLERKSNEAITVNNLIRLGVIAATLALAWYFGQSPSTTYIGYVIALVGIVLVFRYPQLGIIAIVPIAMVVPYSIGTNTQTNLNLAFLMIPLLGAVVFIRAVYYRHKWEALRVREVWPLFGLLVTLLVSFVSGYLPWNAFAQLAPLRAEIGQIAIFAFSVGACVLMPLVIDSERWLEIFVWLFLAMGAIYIVGRAVEPLAPDLNLGISYYIHEATGSLFWLWMVAMAAGQALFNRRLNYWLRGLLVALVLLLFAVAVFSPDAREWASGWVPAGACLALLLWLRWPRFSALMGALMGLTLLLFANAVSQFLLSGDNAYSLLTRTAAIQILWQIIQVNPLLGVGPANYYYYTPLYSILGYFVNFNSHNQYIDIVAQSGFIGLGFFIWFVAGISRLFWKLRQTTEPGSFASGYVQACLGGLAGMLVAGLLGDWVIPFVYNVGVSGFRSSVFGWLFLGGAIAIYLINRKSETATPTPTAPVNQS